ncbi:hypothetical protein HJG60_010752 [Phyllostomus discolor]|uniref:Uncharacterized protein n=1 Tax=Phyllostomus discolor TaxID=89673 RepID=A0A834ECM9_9CHIR|nr:hypothetical protein HJG60_010752 [Phyllostomus discolor]
MGRAAGSWHRGQRRSPRVPGPPADAQGPPGPPSGVCCPRPDARPAPSNSPQFRTSFVSCFPQLVVDPHFCGTRAVKHSPPQPSFRAWGRTSHVPLNASDAHRHALLGAREACAEENVPATPHSKVASPKRRGVTDRRWTDRQTFLVE